MDYHDRDIGPLPPNVRFQFCASGAAPFTFCFEKYSHVPATLEQIADFKRRTKKVAELGGVVIGNEFTIGEKLPPLSEEECAAIRAAVQEANPDLRFHSDWNGVGYYACSVGMMKQPKATKG